MAISDTINSIKTNLSNAYDKCEEKGATIPTDKNIENLTDTIDSISGGGGDISEYFNSTITSGSSSIPGWHATIKALPTNIQPSSTSLSYAYYQFPGSKLDLSNMNTSNVSNFSYAFINTKITEIIGLNSLNTSSVSNIIYLFSNSTLLTKIDISNWDLTHISSLNSVFNSCSRLQNATLPVLRNNSITTLEKLFYNCSNLTTAKVDVKSSGLTSLNGVFYGCSKLTTINGIENWDTSNVSNMGQLFRSNSSLTGVLNLQNFTMKSNCACDQMFYGCSHLTTIDLRNFDIGLIGTYNSMFYGCTRLNKVLLGATSVPTFQTNMFSSSGITTTSGYIYVPDNMVSSFKSASGWSSYANRIFPISDYVE